MVDGQTVTLEEPIFDDGIAKSESTAFKPDAAPDAAPEAAPEPEAKPAEPKAEEPEVALGKEHPFTARTRQLNAKIAAEARRADQAEARAAEYERRLNPPAEPAAAPVQTQADYNRDVQAGVEKEKIRQAFNDSCNKIAETGNAEFKADFMPTLASLWGVIGGSDGSGAFTPSAVALIEAAQEADNPAAALHYLGKNLDEAVRVSALSPTKMGAAMVKLSATLATKATEAKAAAKAATKAPAPMEPVSGGARSSLALGDMGMADYIVARDAEVKALRGR